MAETESISRSRGAEAILDCISDGVITIDLQKRVTFLNRAMQTMLGYEVPDSGMLLACDVLVQSNICSSQDCVLERALQCLARFCQQIGRQRCHQKQIHQWPEQFSDVFAAKKKQHQ